MKQILQDLGNGDTKTADVPCPAVKPGQLLIRTSRSVISAGTEKMLMEFGKANLLEKARQQPDKIHMVLDKIRTDGLFPTLEAVRAKLDQPLPLGYCNAGIVLEVGSGVSGFEAGDRVASNGNHAEIVCVPSNLCAKIPDGVSDEAAAFTVLGAIALQGVRLAEPTLGEAFVVTGLGLIGLVTVQILRAHGCRVLGIDYDPAKLALARDFGAETVDLSKGEDPLAAAVKFSRGRGVDGVLITASTKSNEPVSQGARMCRKRGRIVLIGVSGLELSRADFFEKELTFQVSCSYGPGRYDPDYEQNGHDYPVGFVRWTEQRNFEAVLDMLSTQSLNTDALISHRFNIDDADKAYALLGGSAPFLGVVLQYSCAIESSGAELLERNVSLAPLGSIPAEPEAGDVGIGFIGAGNYAGRVLIPAFQKARARMQSIASSGGVSSIHFGKKYGFIQATTDTAGLMKKDNINAVVIATRHDSHAKLTCDALRSGKNVFVEKPLALNLAELTQIEAVYAECGEKAPRLMVGFNRRFAPHVVKIKQLLTPVREPKSLIMTVNAGMIAQDHWTQIARIGGGRMIGEGCHFVDLMRFLVGFPITNVQAAALASLPGEAASSDKFSVTLNFSDGSIGTLHYLSNGHRSFPKERLEVFCAGRVLQLDNFRRLKGYGWPGFRKMNIWRQDKGQGACAKAFVDAIMQNEPSPINFDELLEVSRVSIEIAQHIDEKRQIKRGM